LILNLCSSSAADGHFDHTLLRLGPVEIDMQQAVFEARLFNNHAIGQDKTADEPPRGDPAVQEGVTPSCVAVCASGAVFAPAGDGQLAVLHAHLQLVGRKARDGQGDADPAIPAVLYIVGGIALGGGLGRALDQTAGVLEAQ
jgi:hypothetical protein